MRHTTNAPLTQLGLEEIPASTLAEQLTLIEWQLFSSIKVPELLNMSWKSDRKHEVAYHVVTMVERTNLLSYWVAMEICTYKNLRKRIRTIEKFINIAWVCLLPPVHR